MDNEGILWDAVDFIATRGCIDRVRQLAVRNIMQAGKPIVFTSARAVREVALHTDPVAGFKVYCIGKVTLAAVNQYFEHATVMGTADDAEKLAHAIVDRKEESVHFFCGDKRMDILPHVLKDAGVQISETTVYEMLETPVKVKRAYDAVLFFSPSCVRSYFRMNEVQPGMVLFAIGNSTARALKGYSTNELIIASQPTKAQVVADAVAWYKQTAIEKQ